MDDSRDVYWRRLPSCFTRCIKGVCWKGQKKLEFGRISCLFIGTRLVGSWYRKCSMSEWLETRIRNQSEVEPRNYDTDLTDKQWQCIQPYLPRLSTRGAHFRQWEIRLILNAICYLVDTDCQWRMLAKVFPPLANSLWPLSEMVPTDRWVLIHRTMHRQLGCQAGRNAEAKLG